MAPDFEAPTDAGADNVYDVTVRVSDGTNTDDQAIAVSVTNVSDGVVGAVSDTNAAANQVAENAANGTVVGVTAFATDARMLGSSASKSICRSSSTKTKLERLRPARRVRSRNN